MGVALNPEIREITSRAEWLRWHREAITASRVAALFDCHPYLSRDGLAASLRGVDQGDNPSMRAGRILEPGIAIALSEDNPDWRITKATTYHVDPTLRFGCTPDFWLDDDRLIQAKTVSPEKWDEWQGRPPLAYTLQTLAELMLTGRVRGVLAIMARSRSYPVHCFDVPRHPAAEAKILAAVAAWWTAWDSGEIAAPAPVDEIAAELDDGSHRDLSMDNQIRELLEERELLKGVVSGPEKRLKEIDYEIRNRIGPARTAWLPGWILKLPTVHTKAYAVAAKDSRRLTIARTED